MYGWVSGADSNDKLVDNLRHHYKLSPRTTAAMKRVDRANYCRSGSLPYDDSPQLIGFGQTISAPHVHALALKALEPNLRTPGASVLDVGSGSGYLAACFAEVLRGESGGSVVGIDNSKGLVEWSVSNVVRDGKADLFQEGESCGVEADTGSAAMRAAESPQAHVQLSLVVGDGYEGYQPGAPYDTIHVGAAMEEVPSALLYQLKPGGLLLGPVGPRSHQEFVLIKKDASGKITSDSLASVRYVPLTHGFNVRSQDDY